MENREVAELKMQVMILESLVASMFAAQQRGTSVNTDFLRMEISSKIMSITQAYYQKDQTASQANAEAEALALWVEVTGTRHIDHMFDLIRADLQRD